MKILHYSQHVLGVGHFFRSLALARALAGHQVVMVSGGSPVDVPLPDHVEHRLLPPLMMDADFRDFVPGEQDPEAEKARIAGIEEERREKLLAILDETQPDVFVVELFPFGRKRFVFELVPALEMFRSMGRGPAVCSVRDILVEKSDQARFEKRVLCWMNKLFDGLMIHSDPELVRFEETFPRLNEVRAATEYTGYVVDAPAAGSGDVLRRELHIAPEEPLIVASAGGGAVGGDVVAAAVAASIRLAPKLPHQLYAFTGPFAEDTALEALCALAVPTDGSAEARPAEHIHCARFTDRFPAFLDAADLSVSMAGYNTTMAFLAARTYGLVLPFDQNREQRMRAERLAQRGALGVLEAADLEPDRLAARMETALRRVHHQGPPDHGVRLDGAARSARFLEKLAASHRSAS
ncbi:MAG: glycosyltransferase family protein [Oceanidesulfovibrio sp.]